MSLCYDASMNKNIIVLIANFNKILAVPNKKEHYIAHGTDSLICPANRLWQKKSTNISYFTFLTHKFNPEESKIYEKTIPFYQIKE